MIAPLITVKLTRSQYRDCVAKAVFVRNRVRKYEEFELNERQYKRLVEAAHGRIDLDESEFLVRLYPAPK
jgi:hypothetical protein